MSITTKPGSPVQATQQWEVVQPIADAVALATIDWCEGEYRGFYENTANKGKVYMFRNGEEVLNVYGFAALDRCMRGVTVGQWVKLQYDGEEPMTRDDGSTGKAHKVTVYRRK